MINAFELVAVNSPYYGRILGIGSQWFISTVLGFHIGPEATISRSIYVRMIKK